ncbi:Uncharacterised protein [Halioglobus japonicus]|nr:Uncharacterised protein [Halioglobus japonicus]
MTIRAVYRAIAIPGAEPPYDRASLKVFYPACYGDTEEERNTGVIPAESERAPFPVVILLPGINVGPESYGWLTKGLAEHGVVAVTFTLVAEEMPGYISLTPGLAIPALLPDNYAKSPSATAVGPILEDLAHMNKTGVLAGCLDLGRIVLGGHSAGGTVALLNARPDWFRGICGAFSYGAHTAAAAAMGYPQDSFFGTPTEVPTLLMGGTRDGCIAGSAGRYGDGQASPTERVERTFDEAMVDNRADCALALIEGANHFSMAYPADESTGRPFIDMDTTAPDEAIRELLLSLIRGFISGYVRNDAAARHQLQQTLESKHPLIARGELRPGIDN